tara:strand:+ start:689 stop:904 length:216 start_codon:yes stop_codon:yes gene_type:complete
MDNYNKKTNTIPNIYKNKLLKDILKDLKKIIISEFYFYLILISIIFIFIILILFINIFIIIKLNKIEFNRN